MRVAIERLIAAAGGEPLSPGKIELPSAVIERGSAGPPSPTALATNAKEAVQ